MPVAIRAITRLQDADDVNVTPGVGVDEYALTYDHDTAKFVLRAPFAGILATGATTGATAQAQAFTLGVVSPFDAPAADSTTAWQVRKADKTTAVVTVDTTNARVGIGTAAPGAKLDVMGGEAAGFNDTIWLSGGAAAYDSGPRIVFHPMFGGLYPEWRAAEIGSLYTSGSKTYSNSLVFSVNDGDTTTDIVEVMRISPNGNVGIGDTAPAEKLDVTGNINATGVYKVDDVQVLSNRVIDARCADVANSGDATTDGLIDALRDAMVAHGLIAAA